MYYCMINPASRSGKGIILWKKFEARLKEQNIPYQAVMTKKAGDATRLTRSLMERHAKDTEMLRLIVLGGDGTMNEVMNGITDFDRIMIGYLSTGSGGDFALGLSLPKDPDEIIERILQGKVLRTVDLGQLTFLHQTSDLSRLHDEEIASTRLFDVSAGIGFDAAVCEEALSSGLKKRLNRIGLGKLTYLFIALRQVFCADKLSIDLENDDGQKLHLDHCLFAAAMLHPYEGGGFKFCPDADPSDGFLDLCVVGDMPVLKELLVLPLAKSGHHRKIKGIYLLRCKSVQINSFLPLWIHTDGEVSMKSDAITLTCLPGKCHLMV